MAHETKMCGFWATEAEQALLCWLTDRLEAPTMSDAIRRLIVDAARTLGAPIWLRRAAEQQRELHPPRKRGTPMIEPDEIQQKVLDLTGKDSGK